VLTVIVLSDNPISRQVDLTDFLRPTECEITRFSSIMTNMGRFILLICIAAVSGHGRLALPPSRSSAAHFGFNVPTNSEDWSLNCGRFKVSYAILLKLNLFDH
jgi:hypothetical protein